MFTTRRRSYSILKGHRITAPKGYSYSHLQNTPVNTPLRRDSSDSDYSPSSSSGSGPRYPPKFRRIFGLWTVRTPNSSRFANHFHSRILVKFPFLIEMFYWAISFFFYRLTAVMTQIQYGGTKILWDVAQGHAISILEFEAWVFGRGQVTGKERWVEYLVQNWYLTGADGGDSRGIWLTILDRGYSLIHIPGTVGYVLILLAIPHPYFAA